MDSSPPPLVSVFIPLYNGAHFIREAIDSVRMQTYPQWELIITDDQSTDGSAEIVSSFSDPRTHYILNAERLGPEGNWNRCVNEAKGKYRKLLCHDDRLHNDCIHRQVEIYEQAGHEHLTLVTCARHIASPYGSDWGYAKPGWQQNRFEDYRTLQRKASLQLYNLTSTPLEGSLHITAASAQTAQALRIQEKSEVFPANQLQTKSFPLTLQPGQQEILLESSSDTPLFVLDIQWKP